MKKHINRNILCADLFVEQLADCGVKYACISPGSRSTPLTFAFAKNKKIKKFVIIDERSSAFFALGLAKKTKMPVAVVTTSGSATAELFPAIVESYKQRVPLIICTGDRPPELYNCGANQTINQINLYNNHIRKFFNAGLPSVSQNILRRFKKTAAQAFEIALYRDRGPVHVNFPFRKPFEPDSVTDQIDKKIIKEIHSLNYKKIYVPKKAASNSIKSVFAKINNSEKGIIICGPGDYSKSFFKLLNRFSAKLNFPVFADAASSVRFSNNNNSITNYDSFLRSDDFLRKFDPKIIIQFGAAPTSKYLLDFFKNSNADKILINEFGDLLDPSKTSKSILRAKPEEILKEFLIQKNASKGLMEYSNRIKVIDNIIDTVRKQKIDKSKFPFEGKIISHLLSLIPAGSNLFISNSMPVRDLDYFAARSNKNLNIYSNRGASGIDGINSTALGMAAASNKINVLITGDLSFYHDLNGLLTANKYKIPLVIILIDNNGGSIFEMLPIAKHKNVFDEYFRTPHNLDFKNLVHGYGGYFKEIKNWKSFKNELSLAFNRMNYSVLRFKTDSGKSHSVRNEFWKESLQTTKKILNDN